MSDVADRLRELADKVEAEEEEEEEVLFTHKGYDAVKEIPTYCNLVKVYRDEDGDPILEVKGKRLLLASHGQEVADAIMEADQ